MAIARYLLDWRFRPTARHCTRHLILRTRWPRLIWASGEVTREIPVGNAPYDVVEVRNPRLRQQLGRSIAGRRQSDRTFRSRAAVRVDPLRNIANDGSVSVVDLQSGARSRRSLLDCIRRGWSQRRMGITCWSRTRRAIRFRSSIRILAKLSRRFDKNRLSDCHSQCPNALATSADGRRVYASNGTNNSIAIIDFAPPQSKLLGCVPTGWYPAGLAFDATRGAGLRWRMSKGVGSRNRSWGAAKSKWQRSVRLQLAR